MYRLLIVDDEHHVADEIETVFLTQTRLELEVYKAYLATDALDIMNRLRIDVLLTDIKMPGADGFFLADQVSSLWPEAKIIFLTAYSEFDLIYKTQKYKSVSFLLKTEGEEAIIKVVQDAISEIERTRRLLSVQAESVVAPQQAARQQALAHYLDSGDMSVLLSRQAIDTQAQAIAILVSFNRKGDPALEDASKLNALLVRAGAMLGGKCSVEAAYTGFDFAVLVFQPQNGAATTEFANSVMQSFDTITENVLEIYGSETVTAVSGQPFPFQELFEKVDNMKQFLASSLESGSGMVFTAEAESTVKKEKDLIEWRASYAPDVNAVIGAIREGEYGQALSPLSVLQKAAETVSGRLHYPIIMAYEKIALCLLDRIISKKLSERISLSGDIYRILRIDSFPSWKDAFNYLENVVQLLRASDTEVRDICESRFLSYIYDYIDRHIGEDLSLSVLSERMNYNPSYISRLFKRLSGQTLQDYITSKRMERAVKMLTETNASIQEIAKASGISSGQYFATVFRKKYGVSPLDYRRDALHK